MSALAFDLAWKSAVLAALVLAATALLRSRPAAERVALLRLGMVVVFALPLLTTVAPALRIQTPALAHLEPARGPAPNATTRPGPVPGVAPIPGLPAAASPTRSVAPAAMTRAAPLPRISPLTALVAVWLAGVAALLLRLLGGVAALALWTRRATPVSHPLWLAALDRAVAGGRRPRLKVSSRIASPLSWSWPRGVILIDEATLSRPDRADAVLTHEMGHIRHHDWLFLMLSHALVAVLWFNPFVWRLRMELARQSEQAADAWAVRRIDRADYAGALVAMARGARPHAALGMAGAPSDLARRVAAILDGSRGKGRPWSTAVAAVACLCAAGPLAALEWAPGALPATLGPSVAAPAPRAVPTTAAAVAALMPEAMTTTDVPPPTKTLSPDQMAALVRQRDLGLAMFEAGARAVEAGAAQIHRQLHLVSTTEEREDMLREAEELAREAVDLRAQARELAARDLATLSPMTETEAREMEIQLQQLQALPSQIGMPLALNTNVAAQVNAQVGADPPPVAPAPPREDIAATLRQHAEDLRRQADDLDQQADDVLND